MVGSERGGLVSLENARQTWEKRAFPGGRSEREAGAGTSRVNSNAKRREEESGAGGGMSFSIRLALPSHPRILSVVRSTVQQLAAVTGFSEDECRGIVLAVDEALANVIRHAYQNRHDEEIEITCRRLRGEGGPADAPDGLEFVLVDRGSPADPAALKGRELEDVRPGGLGLHFIREIMDEVIYDALPDRNQWRLVKRLGARKPEEK